MYWIPISRDRVYRSKLRKINWEGTVELVVSLPGEAIPVRDNADAWDFDLTPGQERLYVATGSRIVRCALNGSNVESFPISSAKLYEG